MFGHVFGAPHGGEMATHYNGELARPSARPNTAPDTRQQHTTLEHGTALIDDAYARIDDYTLVV